MSIRRAIGSWLFIDQIGWLAGKVFGQRIPHRGLKINTRSALISDSVRTALVLQSYESAEYRFVRRFIPVSSDVIELGASIGVMTSQLRRLVDPVSRVIAVEADPRLLPLIQSNLDENCDGPVVLLNRAIAYNAVGPVAFAFGNDTLAGRVGQASTVPTMVEAITLADLIREFSISSFSLVSDIEGAEWDLWRRDRASLLRARCCVLELHDSPDGEPAQTLLADIERDSDFEILGRYGNVVAFRAVDSTFL